MKKTAISLTLIFLIFSAILSTPTAAEINNTNNKEVVVNNMKPQVSINSTVSGNSATISLTGSIDHAAIFDSQNNWFGNFKKIDSQKYEFFVYPLPIGEHTFIIKASNIKGEQTPEPNLTTQKITITIKSPKVTSSIYGYSGAGRPLTVFAIEPEIIKHKALIVFEIHGFEDAYARDGQVLVNIANEAIYYFSVNPQQLGNTALYIVESANPDGLAYGWTNNGPGRCQISEGVDLNRDFDYCWNYRSNSRNKTLYPFSAPESCALRDLVISISPNDVVDIHGWLNTTYGTSSLCQYFENSLGIGRSSGLGGCSGYFAGWSMNYAQRTALIELPGPNTNPQEVINAIANLCTNIQY